MDATSHSFRGRRARGRFDLILALFNSAGALIGQNDDGGSNVPADINGARFDIFLLLDDLTAGDYIVSVSVSPNFANGPTLSDGFQGADSFNNRTAEWAFGVLNAGEATQVGVPEPASFALFGLGLLVLGAMRRREAC